MFPLHFLLLFGVATSYTISIQNPEDQLLQVHTWGHPVSEKSTIIENIILNALNDFKEVMVTGSDTVPVLDPLHVDQIILDDNNLPVEGVHLEVNKLTVTKLSTFVVNDLEVVTVNTLLRRYSIKLVVEVPEIDIYADNYDLDVDAFGLNLFGNGDAVIKLIEPKVDLDLLINIRMGLGALYLNIMDCKIVLNLTDIQPAISGMFHEPMVDDFVNSFLRYLVLDAIETFSEEITEAVSPAVMQLANDALADINLISLIS